MRTLCWWSPETSFFSARGAEALRAMVAGLEELDYVSQVLWMDRVPILNIFGLPEPLLPSATASDVRFAKARDRALGHPLVRGQFLAEDGRTLVMLLRFNWLYVRHDDDFFGAAQGSGCSASGGISRVVLGRQGDWAKCPCTWRSESRTTKTTCAIRWWVIR